MELFVLVNQNELMRRNDADSREIVRGVITNSGERVYGAETKHVLMIVELKKPSILVKAGS